MKRGAIYWTIGIIVLAISIWFLLSNVFIANSHKLDLTDEQLKEIKEQYYQEQILEIVKPEIQSYCQDLDGAATYPHCVICGGSYSGELEDQNYVYVESFDEGGSGGYKYMVEDKGEYYLITSKIHRIAGRNDRPSNAAELIFRVDKEGNILESSIPEIYECSL